MNFKRTPLIIFVSVFSLLSSCVFSGNSSDPSKDDLTINVIAFNDFHGAIEEQNNRMGLAKLGTYLKQQSNKENTLILSQGDDWQGSIYSNHNRGRLVNDVYAYCRVSARTIGNHDFDWGIESLEDNTKTGYDGYVTPVLAANVFDYDFATKTEGDVQISDIGVPSVTHELENGLKVGIVGIIGRDQITTITSSMTEDICFKEHITVLKSEATKLREEGCNIIIASCHGGQSNLLGNQLERFVDLVLCGHTHKNERTVENKLHYYQFGCYGNTIGNITLTYNQSTKKVAVSDVESVTASTVSRYVTTIDSKISSLINTYWNSCEQEAQVVVASSVTGTFYNTDQCANLMAKAIFERAVAEGHDDVILGYNNQSRYTLSYGSWDYADLYQAFPFDNIVYIESVKGSDILYEVASYNNVYISPTFDCKIDPDGYYKIAVIDYLLYHTNDDREYNYFDHFDGEPDDELSQNYRLILKDWLIDNGYANGKNINASDYSSYNESFDGSRLTSI